MANHSVIKLFRMKFIPFLDEFFPLLKILAKEAAKEGFSATINTVFMLRIFNFFSDNLKY